MVADLGANQIIDYTREDALKTDQPYDVIYDTVGTQSVENARKVLTDNGVYMTLVPVDGIEFFVPGQTKRAPHGAYFVAWEAKGADLDVLSGWVRERKLSSVIDSVFPLAEIKQAHEKSETLRARGKIIIKVKDA
jgi:NADPH:quinone reductase-like Zn-dependent oxidoreductase